jgi:cbb3-type cytochrome oxidase maturation protein
LRGRPKTDFLFLVPIAIGLGLVGLASFMWTLKNGQYDGLRGVAARILFEGQGGAALGEAVSGRSSGPPEEERDNSTGRSIRLNAKLGKFEETSNNILLAFFQKPLNCSCKTLARRNRRAAATRDLDAANQPFG